MATLGSSKQTGWLEARCLVAHALTLSLESVPEDALMNTLEAWDSLGHLRIVLEIEDTIGTELTGEQVLSIESIRDIANLLYP